MGLKSFILMQEILWSLQKFSTEGHEPFKKTVGDHNPQTLQWTPTTEKGIERKALIIPLELLTKDQYCVILESI